MKPYKNISGKSGVWAYLIGPDWIKVKFGRNGETYTYSYRSAGIEHVERMKVLAEAGKGLATYINRHVRDLYEE